jgi:hypothetical protein
VRFPTIIQRLSPLYFNIKSEVGNKEKERKRKKEKKKKKKEVTPACIT